MHNLETQQGLRQEYEVGMDQVFASQDKKLREIWESDMTPDQKNDATMEIRNNLEALMAEMEVEKGH
jgi:hypothetical protein